MRRDLSIVLGAAILAMVGPALSTADQGSSAPSQPIAPPNSARSSRPEPIAAMRAAMERGDLDEAARQGTIAGPAVLATALGSQERALQLAAIAAAPSVTDRHELLDPLARVAAGPDRRVAIPAARAAREIAVELSRKELPDDVSGEDAGAWRDRWLELAARRDRWIEVRVFAIDTVGALDTAAVVDRKSTRALDLAPLLADPDPHFRRAVVAVVPSPVPVAMRPALANTVARDTDEATALLAAHVLCFDIDADTPARPILDALGAEGLGRLRTLVGTNGDAAAIRDAARCLAADRSPASAAALRSIKKRPRY